MVIYTYIYIYKNCKLMLQMLKILLYKHELIQVNVITYFLRILGGYNLLINHYLKKKLMK